MAQWVGFKTENHVTHVTVKSWTMLTWLTIDARCMCFEITLIL